MRNCVSGRTGSGGVVCQGRAGSGELCVQEEQGKAFEKVVSDIM